MSDSDRFLYSCSFVDSAIESLKKMLFSLI